MEAFAKPKRMNLGKRGLLTHNKQKVPVMLIEFNYIYPTKIFFKKFLQSPDETWNIRFVLSVVKKKITWKANGLSVD